MSVYSSGRDGHFRASFRNYTFESVRVLSQQEKVAVVNTGEVREFTIVDAATGNRVFSGKPGYIASSAWSDKSRTILDFSDITAPGNYFLMVNGDSVAFEIKERVLSPLADAALKSFYYQRTGMPIERLMRVGGAVRQAIPMTRY